MNEAAAFAETFTKGFNAFGEHPFFCLLYKETSERRLPVLSFLRDGVIRNEKVFCIVGPGRQAVLRSELFKIGLPVEELEDAGSLTFFEEVFISGDEPGPPAERVEDRIARIKNAAMERGVPAVRIFFEMSCGLSAGNGGWPEESFVALDRLTRAGNLSLLLAFNSRELSGPMILEALRFFPAIIHDQQVFRNSYYRKPSELVAGIRPPGLLSWFLSLCRRRGRRSRGRKTPWPYRRGQVLETLLSAAPVGFWLLDNEHRMVFVNRNFCEATGVPAEKYLSAQHYSEVMKPEEALSSMLSDSRAFHADGPVSNEQELTGADGSRHTYQVVKTRLMDEENRISGLLALALDITERKNAERLLRQSETRFRDIALRMADFIWETDDEGIFRYCSDKVREMLGYAAEEMIGQKYTDFFSEEAAGTLARSFCPAGEQGGVTRNLEHWVVDKSGQRRCLRSSGVPVFDDNGSVLGFRGVTEDITRQWELDRHKAEFMSMVAHELRTPLTSILGYLEFCLNPDDFGGFTAEQQREFLEEINGKAELLSRLVSDLLDIGRVESGRPLPLEIRPFSMEKMIGKAVERFQLQAPRHRFVVKPEPGPMTQVLADEDKLAQVLENLLSNAVKYSPEGNLVEVAGGIQGDSYQVVVKDEGIGMTPEQVARVFDKFYRADYSNTAVHGLGLGMSIARQIVERHGGDIRVESEVGRGTRVVFSVPMQGENAEEAIFSQPLSS
jgi:PAS domain S-box-containing protein